MKKCLSNNDLLKKEAYETKNHHKMIADGSQVEEVSSNFL